MLKGKPRTELKDGSRCPKIRIRRYGAFSAHHHPSPSGPEDRSETFRPSSRDTRRSMQAPRALGWGPRMQGGAAEGWSLDSAEVLRQDEGGEVREEDRVGDRRGCSWRRLPWLPRRNWGSRGSSPVLLGVGPPICLPDGGAEEPLDGEHGEACR